MQIAVVGGGIAGLSAAEALRRQGVAVTLFEAKSRLGGRAASFLDKASGDWIDLCQHVGMGCCTEWLDFCDKTGVSDRLRRDRVIYFLGSGGRRYRFAAAAMLPPPLHLSPALLRMSFLSWRERLELARNLRALQSLAADDDRRQTPSIGQWLTGRGVSQRALRRFYEPVLVSALGESLEHASLAMARKVFVDAFLAQRDGFHLITPTCSLAELYDQHVGGHLERTGVRIRRSSSVRQLVGDAHRISGIELVDGFQPFDAVVVALPWTRVESVLPAAVRSALPWLANVRQMQSAPITGVQLWFDRPILDLPHGVVLDRLSQWIFAKPRPLDGPAVGSRCEHYYQVIVSASHGLRGRSEDEVVAEVIADLRTVLPSAVDAHLVRSRVTTEPQAVFSVRPGLSELRPAQATAIAGLAFAGDWTATGWPATMEGAVRSGRLAAAALAESGRPVQLL